MSCESQHFAYGKTKVQISFALTAKLINTFVFATLIVQFLYFLNQKFPACSHLLAIFCDCTDRFVSDLFRNHIVGFLMMWLIFSCSTQHQGRNSCGIVKPFKGINFIISFFLNADKCYHMEKILCLAKLSNKMSHIMRKQTMWFQNRSDKKLSCTSTEDG